MGKASRLHLVFNTPKGYYLLGRYGSASPNPYPGMFEVVFLLSTPIHPTRRVRCRDLIGLPLEKAVPAAEWIENQLGIPWQDMVGRWTRELELRLNLCRSSLRWIEHFYENEKDIRQAAHNIFRIEQEVFDSEWALSILKREMGVTAPAGEAIPSRLMV